ncbi:trypsin-like peptidase domain-containing protein [Acidovorax sp. NCPPB 2350]|nr:trypsin-like peptidase domain-containing protein [Acidovorax sp. NCPPB 2350]
MPRPARYSPSRRTAAAAPAPLVAPLPAGAPAPSAHPSGDPETPSPVAPARRRPWLWPGCAVLTAALLAAGLGWVAWRLPPDAPRITQKDIDAAVLRTLETQPMPSAAARAAEAVAPSVVRVTGFGRSKKGKEEERGIGTGVVIVDKGVILTNLHVVRGAARVQVTFADGSDSDATLTGVQPENDLAVLQARKVPDDLVAAPLRSTQGLKPGDGVVAIGFPFGIGPSVSSGVISGLQREFESPQGKQEMRNLIQFDAAANPGNSGGPLLTLDGEVIGIVTAILNPTPARTFIGIGFAVPIENAAQAAGMPPF